MLVFCPLLVLDWEADAGVCPFVAVTPVLQPVSFALLSTAHRHAEISVVYPVARGLAPVLALVVGVLLLGIGVGVTQAAAVCLERTDLARPAGAGRRGRGADRTRLRSRRATRSER